MKRISYSGYRLPPAIIQQAIWLYLRFTLSLRDVEDLLAERGITVSYESIRRWINHFGPLIAADLRRRRPKPQTSWHLDEVYLKIDGRMAYLWRAVDAEGEILDVLVQSKRDKHAALKLMRKLLKKYGFVPDRLITDDLRSYGAAARDLGIEKHMNVVGGRTIERRTRISQPDDESARCRASRAEDQPNDSSQPMQPSTIPSTSNVI
jgi:putative transposase